MNTFGRIFRLNIFGESHGPLVGITLDGVPAGMPLCAEDFAADLDRRRAGAIGTTPRKESDIPRLVSGVFNQLTTGAPLTIVFENGDVDSDAYQKIKDTPRPGHADFVAWKKFAGFNDWRGGGHFSGRMTVALVAAGVVAKKIISPLKVTAELLEVGGEKEIQKALADAVESADSIGGLVECRVNGVPVGLGEPFFDSLESLIAHAVFSIPAIKGIEFGAGFKAASMRGSQTNDDILDLSGQTATNNAGGINGGISNGNELVFRVAVKPTSSIAKPGNSVDLKSGEAKELTIGGRHDACIALRVPPVLEAMCACVLADLSLIR